MTPYYSDNLVTLYHADCREILPTFADECVEFVFTDPPYGHNNNNDDDLIARWESALGRGTPGPTRPISNDHNDGGQLVRWAFGEFNRLLMPGCCCCCCGGGGPDPQFARWSLWLDEAIGFKQMVVWDKGPMGMGWHYRRSYETVLVAEKPGAACRWFDRSSKVENIIRHIPRIIPNADEHPTPKPIDLVTWFVRLHTQPGDLILDPFAGHGPTLVAAKLASCRAIGVELDESFCESAARRLSQGTLELTGPTASSAR